MPIVFRAVSQFVSSCMITQGDGVERFATRMHTPYIVKLHQRYLRKREKGDRRATAAGAPAAWCVVERKSKCTGRQHAQPPPAPRREGRRGAYGVAAALGAAAAALGADLAVWSTEMVGGSAAP